MKAIIVGGGVAGTATALAFHKVGVESVVLERRTHAQVEQGSYFSLAPNGIDALRTLGVFDRVREEGFRTSTNNMVGATGTLLGSIPLGPALDDGWVGLTIKRSRMAALLAEEAIQRGVDVRLDASVTSMTDHGDHVTVNLADGTSVEGDLLVGADGVWSSVRREIDPDARPARYVGLTNFGGITRRTAIAAQLPPEAWQFVFGRRAFTGSHPTPSGDVVWFVNVPEPEIAREVRASTTDDEWKRALLDLVSDDAGPMHELIANGELELAGDNTYDLGHVPIWSRGRMIVLGDAAHAPSPSSGQGASMALEDALVLAQAIRDNAGISDAFAAFEGARRGRVEAIVAAGARSSSSKVPGRIGRVFQDAIMRLVFRYAVTPKSTAWIAGHRIDWDERVVA